MDIHVNWYDRARGAGIVRLDILTGMPSIRPYLGFDLPQHP